MTGLYLILLGTLWAFWLVPRLAELEIEAWRERKSTPPDELRSSK